MQGLGDAFQLAVAFQTAPIERFAGGPIDRIPDRQAKLGFNLQLFWIELGLGCCPFILKKSSPLECP